MYLFIAPQVNNTYIPEVQSQQRYKKIFVVSLEKNESLQKYTDALNNYKELIKISISHTNSINPEQSESRIDFVPVVGPYFIDIAKKIYAIDFKWLLLIKAWGKFFSLISNIEKFFVFSKTFLSN